MNPVYGTPYLLNYRTCVEIAAVNFDGFVFSNVHWLDFFILELVFGKEILAGFLTELHTNNLDRDQFQSYENFTINCIKMNHFMYLIP